MEKLSLLGLGDMGASLASVLIQNGYDVTVWNRSPARSEPFAKVGATVAESAAQAIGASSTVLFCVKTHADTLNLINLEPDLLKGRRIIELSTGDGPAAAKLSARITELGATCQIAMILAGPAQIGQDGTAFLMAGDAKAWEQAEPIIRTLAPASDYIGADVTHLADLFSALFLPRQGAMFGMIYGAHFCEVAGVPMDVYLKQLPAAMRVATELYAPTVAATIPHDDYSGSGSPLKVYEHAFRDGFASFRTRGANMELSDLFEKLIAEGMKEGYAEEHLTSLIKVLRKGPNGSENNQV